MVLARSLSRERGVRIGGGILLAMLLIAVCAPWLGTVDPTVIDAGNIDLPIASHGVLSLPDGSEQAHFYLMGADSLGRDLFSRVVYGTRVSLLVGGLTAIVAIVIGGLFGVVAGYARTFDQMIMRVMDGLMAIPALLLAIMLVAALGGSITTLVIAISLPEIPRVTRLVRSLVLTLREEAFVEAARVTATRPVVIVLRHILPNAIAPLLVQGTFICASAILTEAILSFLGLGLPADIPTWGNIMADARVQFSQNAATIACPALFLIPTVLAINLLGDGLRDALDPKIGARLR